MEIKHKLFVLIVLFCFSSIVHSQRPAGKVVYDFDMGILNEATLYFTSNAQQFRFDIENSEYAKLKKAGKSKETLTVSTTKSNGIENIIYSNWKEKIFKQRYVQNKEDSVEVYIINDSVINHLWKLTSEKKEILGFECQKATVDFRGRLYEAWYTPKIPIGIGPWKFFGLPGAILEVRESKGKIFFLAREILFPYEYEISKIENFAYEGIKMEWLDYEIMKRKRIQKVVNYAISKTYAADDIEDDVEVTFSVDYIEIIDQEIIDNYTKK